jgi:predicted porin
MQKKIIAAAVAGALALPAAATWAQSSTVQIYGRVTYEYGNADQGSNRPDVDYADTPGGSAIGFRGEEKLGGGLSAWFQCETSADIRGFDQIGLCSRNSAVGFKGGFGNVFFGRWDTPLKRAMNVGTVGAEETGILGMSFLPFGGSGGSSAAPGAETQQRQRFKRRETGLSYYETPNFGGFMVMGAVSSGNNAADVTNPAAPGGVGALDGQSNEKPRVWSIAATFTAGPFGLGAGYEKHAQFGTLGSPAGDQDDEGYGVSAAFTFGPVKVGGTWLRREFETAAGTQVRDLRQDTFTLGADWRIAGPHSIQGQWAHGNKVKGSSLAGIGGNGGLAAPRVCSIALVGGVCNGIESERGDTGGDAFSISYAYAFSKRTRVKIGYVRVENDDNSASARIGNTANLTSNGQSVDGYAFHISHSF